jgi:hypothetical protein
MVGVFHCRMCTEHCVCHCICTLLELEVTDDSETVERPGH